MLQPLLAQPTLHRSITAVAPPPRRKLVRSSTAGAAIMTPPAAVKLHAYSPPACSPCEMPSPNAAAVVVAAMFQKIFSWKCCICLEEQSGSDLCHTGLCGSNACTDSFCRSCLEAYFSDATSYSRFTVLPIRCPAAECRRRVPTERWAKLVPVEILEAYHKGAKDSLTFRCPECHESGSLIVENVTDPQFRAEAVEDFLVHNRRSPFHAERLFRRRWAAFSTGASTVDQLLDALLAVLGCGSIDDLSARVLRRVLLLIPDVERRCALHLACLRRHPLIWTPCCGATICWRCQVAGGHDGMTCEEFQRDQLAIECQFCPGCGVATQRTEGCNHIICPCGENWSWQEGVPAEDWGAPGDAEDWAVPAAAAADGW